MRVGVVHRKKSSLKFGIGPKRISAKETGDGGALTKFSQGLGFLTFEMKVRV